MRPSRIILTLAAALALSGCGRGFFTAHGTVASEGTRRNTWRSTPQGCTRDPFDGLPADKSQSIATLLWADPATRDPKIDNRDTAPDAPMRLAFSHANPASDVPNSACHKPLRSFASLTSVRWPCVRTVSA